MQLSVFQKNFLTSIIVQLNHLFHCLVLGHIKNIDSSSKMITADQSQTACDKIYRYSNTEIIAKFIDID
jgi:hypothetical protein